jgi:hypothetical protein
VFNCATELTDDAALENDSPKETFMLALKASEMIPHAESASTFPGNRNFVRVSTKRAYILLYPF